jgi:hypothetical protein
MTEAEIREYNSKCTNSKNYELSYVGTYGITVLEHATGEFIDFYWHAEYDLWGHIDRLCVYTDN